ncbi:MAG: ABC transporter ATP-binding protein [Capsulimonadales bacterium]|nr:ABC transporter ATP-binding protein [Capsulimonadales bacterium]
MSSNNGHVTASHGKSHPAISIRGLSKMYRLGGAAEPYRTVQESLLHRLRNPLEKAEFQQFWALRDISFDVEPGDVVGVIGRNGAGKSTLLKILSRITRPTQGEVILRGRVGSLLEVGTGFHPELTGRENIYLNGSILGMKRHEIERQFDSIVEFAEVEKFLDTPVKRYSSGMYVRLAFAVAAHLNPEILIVDEVLAVGDAQFQKKCLGKMGEVAQGGRTVLFVSHNMGAVATLTKHCAFLAKGQLVSFGPTEEVLRQYSQSGQAQNDLVYSAASSEEMPRVTRVEVITTSPDNVQICGRPMEVIVEVSTPEPIRGCRLSFQICNELEQPIVHLWLYDSDRPICREPGIYRFRCRIPHLHLYLGRYSLTVYLGEFFGGQQFEKIELICPFDVVIPDKQKEGGWFRGTCAYLEEGDWDVETLSPSQTVSPMAGKVISVL